MQEKINIMEIFKKRKILIFLFFAITIFFGVVYLILSQKTNFKVCDNISELTDKRKCWEKAIEDTLKVQGIDATFNLVNYFYNQDGKFASDCHSYIHLVGEKAYQVFSEKDKIRLSSKGGFCGYGFYHGFMETLLLQGNDISLAGQFCDYAQKEVGGKNDVKGACFHGIGHGITEDHDKKSWSDEFELVRSPLSICEQITEDEYMIQRCASGVFNVLAMKYTSAVMPLDKIDPVQFCKKQSKTFFKKPCFEEMNTMLISLSGNDFLKAFKFIQDIEEEYADSAVRSLASVAGMQYKSKSFEEQIQNCRNLPGKFQPACIRGFVGGLIEAQTTNQDAKALSFCNSPELQAEEKDNCYQEALRLLSLYLPSYSFKGVCRKLDKQYQSYCHT